MKVKQLTTRTNEHINSINDNIDASMHVTNAQSIFWSPFVLITSINITAYKIVIAMMNPIVIKIPISSTEHTEIYQNHQSIVYLNLPRIKLIRDCVLLHRRKIFSNSNKTLIKVII
jgi:hypothetical protein